jgi:DNA-directed RNA polymerase specialized sigma24 family protein
MMHNIDSLVERLNVGEESAYNEIFNEYYASLVRLAQRKLSSMPPQVADDEGAVVSAFRSFFSGVDNGQFDQIIDRHELWKVLATITVRKSIAQLRRHFKQSGEANQIDRTSALELLRNSEPTPASVVELVDQCEHLLSQLPDAILKQIAVLRLQGFDSREIADMVDLHQRSVQRKLSLIASAWTELSD